MDSPGAQDNDEKMMQFSTVPQDENKEPQVIKGIIICAAGLALIPLPGPGWVIVIYGLELIRPGNQLTVWLRKKIPGVPETGAVPKKMIALGLGLLLCSTIVSIFWGKDIWDWFWGLF